MSTATEYIGEAISLSIMRLARLCTLTATLDRARVTTKLYGEQLDGPVSLYILEIF